MFKKIIILMFLYFNCFAAENQNSNYNNNNIGNQFNEAELLMNFDQLLDLSEQYIMNGHHNEAQRLYFCYYE